MSRFTKETRRGRVRRSDARRGYATARASHCPRPSTTHRPLSLLPLSQIAKRQGVVNPENTFFSVKRFIGRRWDEVGDKDKEIPYGVKRGDNGNVKVECTAADKDFAAEEISAQVLRKLTDDAAAYLGDEVTKAVITVPAYFNDSQRQATKDAGTIAGIEVLRIINEPTAASLAYGFEKKSNETILIFDLGGGTFDVSILEVGDGVFEVLSTSGDTFLGGDDFDKRIVEWLASDFQQAEGVDLMKDKQALQRLTEAAEKAKMELSSTATTAISLPFITATAEGPKHIDTNLSKRQVRGAVRRSHRPLQGAGRERPARRQARTLRHGRGDPRRRLHPHPRRARARQVAHRQGAQHVRQPRRGGGARRRCPGWCARRRGVRHRSLLDVTPLSLGLETLGGVMTKLIMRNTTLPTSKSEVFSTAADGQTSVEINVLQGEREFVKDNKSLGNFRLDGIPSAPRGVPQIEVKFDIDANGILSVSAADKGTGKQADIKITGASTLSEDEVEKMVKDAEAFASEDAAKRDAVDTKNSADSMCYQTEKQLTELGDKIPDDVKEKVNAKVADLKAAIEADDLEGMKEKQEALQQEVMAMGQAMYQGADAGAAAPGGGAPPGRRRGQARRRHRRRVLLRQVNGDIVHRRRERHGHGRVDSDFRARVESDEAARARDGRSPRARERGRTEALACRKTKCAAHTRAPRRAVLI